MTEYYQKLIKKTHKEDHIRYYKSMILYFEGGKKKLDPAKTNKLKIKIKGLDVVFDSLGDAAEHFKCSTANISRILSERNGVFKKHNCTIELA